MPSHNSVGDVGVKVTTTDATKTEIARFQTQENKTYLFVGMVIGRSTTNNAGYVIAATFKNVAGTVTQVGSTAATSTMEDAGAWTVEAEVDGVTDATDVIFSVTGEAAVTVYWTCALQVLEG